jgi:hypothetical protein
MLPMDSRIVPTGCVHVRMRRRASRKASITRLQRSQWSLMVVDV